MGAANFVNIDVELDLTGLNRIRRVLNPITAEGLTKIAEAIKNEIDESFTRPEGTVSAPGDPPGIQSGELRRGLQVEEATARNMVATIKSTTAYSDYVEFGHSVRGGYVAPRPFMRPAANRVNERGVKRIFRDGYLTEGLGDIDHFDF